jgi:RimJ/RimL family protein N-acetyltransferase
MFEIRIEPITESDIPYKVKWYNDEVITRYLHYEETFTIEKSLEWLKKIRQDPSRYENVIKVRVNDSFLSIGIIGLFNIDLKHKKAGFYITIGEQQFQGKGIAKKATVMFLRHCFEKFDLQKIYLYTDLENITAQKLYERVGFKREGILRRELFVKGRFIDRCYYGMLREEFFSLYDSHGEHP